MIMAKASKEIEVRPEPIIFDYKEIVTALIKQQGLNEGIWALYVEFGLVAANFAFADEGQVEVDQNAPPTNILPTALIPIKKVGLIRSNLVSNISVDAAKVNPKPKSIAARKTPKKK